VLSWHQTIFSCTYKKIKIFFKPMMRYTIDRFVVFLNVYYLWNFLLELMSEKTFTSMYKMIVYPQYTLTRKIDSNKCTAFTCKNQFITNLKKV